MFGPINKKNKKEKNQINKTLKSKFVYEDCFVYDESRFTGKNLEGVTPLMAASSFGREQVIALLIAHGANIEATAKCGSNALHFACKKGYLSVAKILLEEGANPNTCNRIGNSPLQLSTENGYTELTEFIKSALINMQNSSQEGAAALECVVCKDIRQTTVMTLPCRHAVTCQKCVDDMEARGDNKCPLCRAEVDQHIPIFLNWVVTCYNQ